MEWVFFACVRHFIDVVSGEPAEKMSVFTIHSYNHRLSFSFFFVMPRRLHKTRKTKRLRRYGGENKKQKQQEKLADEIVALHREHDDKDKEKFRQKMKAYLDNMSKKETVQQTMLRELNSKNKEGQSVDDMITVIWKDKKTKFEDTRFKWWWTIPAFLGGLLGGISLVENSLNYVGIDTKEQHYNLIDMIITIPGIITGIAAAYGTGRKEERLKKLTKKHEAKNAPPM